MKSLFEIGMDVRWGDMDAFNHVNNVSYLRYLEEARVAWFKSLHDDWASVGSVPILAAATVNYRRPITWPERLHVALAVEKIGNRSLTLNHTIRSASAPESIYADGTTVMVWVDSHGVAVPLPDSIRHACI